MTGFSVSLVLHVVILLVLAMLFNRIETTRPLAIEITFGEAATEPPEDSLEQAEVIVEPPVGVDDAAQPEEPVIPEPEPEPPEPEDPEPPVPEEEPAPVEPEMPEAMEPPDESADKGKESESVAKDDVPGSEEVSAPLDDGPVREFLGRPRRGWIGSPAEAPPGRQPPGGAAEAEFGRRLRLAGAKTGAIQVSMLWNSLHDLDLHVIAPSGDHIFFGSRFSRCGGLLDVDMNVFPQTPSPVENVFWPPRRSPPGQYQVWVHHYTFHAGPNPAAFQVRIVAGGRKAVLSGQVAAGQPAVLVTKFMQDGTGLPQE